MFLFLLEWPAATETIPFYLIYNFKHDLHVQSFFFHKPSSKATAWLETGRWGGEMGRKGRGCTGEKTKEEERCYGRPGESSELPWATQQMCHHSSVTWWPVAGFSPKRFTSRDLLQSVALARPPVTPRVKALRGMWVSIWLQTEGGLHQPISLQACGESW